MWGKTITFKILSDYIFSINDLIDVLPVKRGYFYTTFIVLFLVILLLFLFVRPKYTALSSSWKNALNGKNRYRPTALCLLFIVGGLLFRKQIISYKTRMHFSEEPVLEFVFGPMWYPESLDDLYSAKGKRTV